MSPSQTQPKIIPTPWWVLLLLHLMGPVQLVVIMGLLLNIHLSLTETATAEVTEVIRRVSQTASSSASHDCPVFRWPFAGTVLSAESKYCGDPGDFTVGQKLTVRFDPDDPKAVVPDTWWATYGFMLIAAPIGIAVTIMLVPVWRKKFRTWRKQ